MIWKPRYKVGTDANGQPMYKESKFWWMEFTYCGNLVRQSTKQTLKTNAERVERDWRRKLEDGLAGISDKPLNQALTFETAANEYIQYQVMRVKIGKLQPSSLGIETLNLAHLLRHFGNKMLVAIAADDFTHYQQARQQENCTQFHPTTKKRIAGKRLVSNSTINLELGTFRAILKRNGQWERLKEAIEPLDVDDNVGRAISQQEEEALLKACSLSRSKCLYPFVLLLLETGARFSTVQNLSWHNIDFEHHQLRFGADKTKAGSGRRVPLSPRAYQTLKFWASEFPNRKPEHFVFPSQRYGGGGKKDHFGFTGGMSYGFNPNRSFKEIKEAWERAKLRAAQILANDETVTVPLKVRFHDLRHTAISRMVSAGIPLIVIAKLVGWSSSTTTQMAYRYSHPSDDAMRSAVATIQFPPKPAQDEQKQTVSSSLQRPN